MIIIKRTGILLIFILISIGLKAQFSVSGKILNAENSEPLSGANVYLTATAWGAATNQLGNFSMKNIPQGKYTLRISYFGFETLEKQIEIKADMDDFLAKLQPTTIDLNAVVVTGTRTEKTLKNTPVLTHLIGKDAIENKAITYLPQILAQTDAAFEMYKDNTVSSFSLDGLGAKYVLFLIDGERIAGETKGSVELSRINPAGIERIEMIRGAASTLYGSNAIGGVVNIITRSVSKPVEIQAGVKTALYNDPAKDEGRSDNFYYTNINLSSDKLSSFTSVKLNHYAPYDLSKGAGVYALFTQEKENNFLVSQKLNYRAGKKLSLTANGNYFQLDRDYQLAGYPDKLTRDFSWGAKGNYFASDKARFELSYHSDRNKIFDVINENDQLDYDNRFSNLRMLATLEPLKQNILSIGTEYVREKQSSAQNNIEDKTLDNVIVYAQNEWMASELFSLTGGARMEFTSSYGNHFTPQASAMLSPGNFKIRANYGKGFRAPTVKELFTNHFRIPAYGAPFPMYLDGNPDLKPEESNFYALSAQYTNSKADISISYSVNEITNLITSDSLYQVIMDFTKRPPMPKEADYIYANVDEARISSLNFLMKYRLTDELTFSASYKFSEPKNLTTNKDLLNVRKHNARVNLDYAHAWNRYQLNINLNGCYMGSKTVIDVYPPVGQNVGSSQQQGQEQVQRTKKLDDFSTWSLTTTHVLDKHYTVTLGINNIFDYTDKDPRYFNFTSPGRMWIVGLSINL